MKKALALILTLMTLIATCILFFSCDENDIKDKLSEERPAESATECAKASCSDGLEFISNNDGSCSVTGIGTCTDEHIVIPSTAPDGDKVTEIADGAFYNCKDIRSVVLSASVKSIGTTAFEFCENLESVTLQKGVESIGDMAFHCCYSLQSIFIPESVDYIGVNPFLTCKNLQYIAVSKNNSDFYVKGNCLIDKKNSTLICAMADWEIPNDGSIAVIGKHAFFNQIHSTNCKIPNGVKIIKEYAFNSFFNLYLSSTIETIGENAFSKTSSPVTIHFAGTKDRWNKVSKPSDWSHSNYTVFFAENPQKLLSEDELYNVWQFVDGMYTNEKDLAFDYKSSMGYCLKDLNSDGSDELILMAKHTPTDTWHITAILSINNKSVELLQSYEYTDEISVWIDANGCIHYEDIKEMYHEIYKINSNYEIELFAGYNYERSTSSLGWSYNYFYNGTNGSTSNLSWLYEKYTDCVLYYDYDKIEYMENAVGIMFTPLTPNYGK